MKNKKLRNVLISAGSAVLVGVLLLGMNAALGDVPGYNPPGTGVSPTFTGLQVTGNVDAGSITFNTDLTGGAVNVASIISLGNVAASGDLFVDGSISSGGAGYPPLSIDDSVITTGYLEVQGQLRAGADLVNPYSAVPPKGTVPVDLPVNINDDLDVTGDIQLGTGSMFGSVYKVHSSTSGTWLLTDSCYSDDILLNCGGYSSAGLRGLFPTQTICTVYATSSSVTLYAYLTCLDPEGVRTGINP